MHPGRHHDRSDAMGDEEHVARRDPVSTGDMPDESVHVGHQHTDIAGRATFAWRIAMAACVPRKDVKIIES